MSEIDVRTNKIRNPAVNYEWNKGIISAQAIGITAIGGKYNGGIQYLSRLKFFAYQAVISLFNESKVRCLSLPGNWIPGQSRRWEAKNRKRRRIGLKYRNLSLFIKRE